MPRPRAATAALAACLALAGAPASAAGVTLSPSAQSRLGVETQTLTPTKRAAEIDAFAKVLDPTPLIQAESDLLTAEAAAAASSAEAKRSEALATPAGGLAAKAAEAAIAQAKADALHVELDRREIDLAWGPGVSRLSDAQREKLVRGLAKGAIALVHVDTHNNEGQAGARSVRVDVGDGSVTGPVIGPARQAEPRLQSSGLIVEISGPSAMLLATGLVQSAHIATSSQQSGVLIPRGAVIRFAGSDWAYVRTGPTSFERRLLQSPEPEDNGLFVSTGFSGGDEVVVQGAAALFAAEQTSSARAG